MERERLRSKFLGSLIGTGVGDSLGASLEGWHMVDPAEVRALAESRHTLIYTDDTHMTLGVAESLIANKGFDGEHMTHRLMENYSREPFRGYGPGPPRVFRLIKGGEAWDKAAEKLYGGGSFGNGAAMRIAPVGIFYHDEPAKLKEIAYKSSQITHAHELGKEGAALQAYAVALATRAKPSLEFGADEFLRRLTDFIEHEVYKQKLKRAKELLGEKDKSKVITELGHGIEAFNSVPTAIYSFLSHSNSFEEAVIYAISLGGDTDTIGAMTGAICGAYLGVEAIPHKWQAKLENREYIGELAEKLWHIRVESPKGSNM
jgi:poly(ADP-ribose) glycohydrolase ARH3